MDLDRPSGEAELGAVDVSPWADADGFLEADVSHVHGRELFVFAQRLAQQGQTWPQADDDIMLVVDTEAEEIVDELPTLGRWPRQLRADPDQPGIAYVLSTGIMEIDLEDRTVAWAIDEVDLHAAGVVHPNPDNNHLLPQSFDVGPEGAFYIAAYFGDYEEVKILRGAAGEVPEVIIEDGLNAVGRTLEVFEDELWFGDATVGRSGLRGWDLSEGEVRVLSEIAVSTGLAPYSMVGY
jgi:hypothetical protein